MKTFLAKKDTVQPKWHIVDAEGQVLGRMAVKIANVLRGRHKVSYTPHVDTGDYVIVINCEKIVVTGKKEVQNSYMFYSGFVGGESYRSFAEQRVRNPQFIVEHAVKGMLPKNRLARQMLKKLRVFAGPEHTHVAQNPTPMSV
jgi:large subunit ribosomal protein L13